MEKYPEVGAIGTTIVTFSEERDIALTYRPYI